MAEARKQKLKIKKGDTVQVISGATPERGGDRGKTGKVIEVFPLTGRVLVEGVNRVKKHVKVGSTGRGAKTGGIETHEAPVHISNVMLVDPSSKKPTGVGSRTETVERDGRERTVRVRVARRSGKDI
jgi:large subunit ribosomal protein L24